MSNRLKRARSLRFAAAIFLPAAWVVVLLTASSAVGQGDPGGSRASSRAETGEIRGSVTLGPRLTARKIHFTLYPDVSNTSPSLSPPAAEEVKNVVLYLDSKSPGAADAFQATGPFRMEQRGESFVPHILPVPKGSVVEFPNGDLIYHNVFSLSKAASFDLGRYPRGSSRSVRFDEPGIVKVFCHIHPNMSAVILVLDRARFTSPDSEGRFAFPGLPAGTYTITAWHERARPVHRELLIQPGSIATADFAIPLEDAPLGE